MAVLVQWFKSHVHQVQVESANEQIERAIKSASERLADGDVDQAEKVIQAALANDLATNKGSTQSILDES